MKKIFKLLVVSLIAVFMTGCGSEKLNYITDDSLGFTTYEIEGVKYMESEEKTNFVKIEVENYGIMIAELYPEIAPITVENFKNLVSEGFYDGIIFHRVIKDFMIQTGDPTGTGYGGSEKNIKGEFALNGVTNNLSHTRGVLSMARQGANPDTEETMNSASSQFFIVHQDSKFLDELYAGFGKLINGYDVLDKIANVETNSSDKPLTNQIIVSIKFVKEYKG